MERLLRLSRPDQRDALLSLVSGEFRRALLMSEQDELRPDENHFALGLTSLRAVEITQRLEAELGCELGTSVLFNSATVQQVVDHVAEVVLPQGGADAGVTPQRSVDRHYVDDLIKNLYES